MNHIDFHSIAKGKETVVFLMGLSKLDKIVENLLDAGMSKDMDIAVIGHAYMPDQIVIQGTLENIVERVNEANVTSPGIIALGTTIAFRNKYKKSLVTKVGPYSKLADLLKEKGYQVDEISLGAIKYFDFELKKDYNYIIFTSKNGIEAFFNKDVDVHSSKLIAIGEKSAKYLKEKGYEPYFVSKGNSNELIRDLKSMITEDDSVLYVRAKHVSSNLKEYFNMDEVIVYENEEVKWNDLNVEIYDGIFFTCASSVERFLQKVKVNCPIYSIGPVCSKAIQKYGYEPIEAEKSNFESMVKLL